MYNVCSNSMSTLHKYLKYTLDMYLFLLPSFLSLRPASGFWHCACARGDPDWVLQFLCSAQLCPPINDFHPRRVQCPMVQCVHTELAIKWDRVSPNGPLFKCSNSQNIGKTQVTATGPSEWDIWAGESCTGNTWTNQLSILCIDDKIRPFNWEN